MALALQNALALENRGFPGRVKQYKKYGTWGAAKAAGLDRKSWDKILATAKRRGLKAKAKKASSKKGKAKARRAGAKKLTAYQLHVKRSGLSAAEAAKTWNKKAGKPKAAAKAKSKAKASRKTKRQPNSWIQYLQSRKGSGLSMAQLKAGYWAQHPAQHLHPQFHPSANTFVADPGRVYSSSLDVAAPIGYGVDPNEFYAGARPNGLALLNPIHIPSIGGIARSIGGYVVGTAIPAVVVFYAMDKVVPVLQDKVYEPVASFVEDKVPFIGSPVATALRAAPNAVTGAIVGGALALPVIGRATSRLPLQAELAIVTVAAVAPIIGFFMDWPSIKDAATGGSETLAGLALTNMGGLALENLGGLALENLGGIAVEPRPFGDALGDGMAYQTTPLSAASYAQASLADAAYSGADFSPDEGQALLNGTFGSTYGNPPVRAAARRVGASHLAGRPGHRWGWLVQLVGAEKARQIAGLAPAKRVKLIAKLRKAALQAFAQANAVSVSRDSSDIALAHAATQASSQVGVLPAPAAPGAPSGPSGAGSDLGAALFVGD